ncbi:uroporphyrinogen-III synthase [Rhizobium sp. SSA_523]|uniref:uroporphyrinogen-III synthase n=1 Tax=Rhizobium sp. SSA_523 TaxID=2952477 RepID=UPI002091C55D|nr:uroporphyrinogen-III synthase [Rhizobium sp. SSA_523]MCO5733571.1 uroporphyrinogen-III synthase [Rhizobium sp. SSA_523]WKC23129.1 uroporphyrinogen-III synthase [Rhizobium sp. SSA_523]
MRVIVTRPARSAARTAEKLLRMGHQPVLLPLSAPEHRPDAIREALAVPHSAIAVTSAEAIRALQEVEPGDHLATPVFAVGPSTAACARQAGFRSVEEGPGHGEGLARQVIEKNPKDILYLAGTPRAPAFESLLRSASVALHVVEAYRMVEVAWSKADLSQLRPFPPALLLYSKEAARLFFQRALPLLDDEPEAMLDVYCLSRQIAEAVPRRANIHLHVSDHPNEDDLLFLLSSRAGTKLG